MSGMVPAIMASTCLNHRRPGHGLAARLHNLGAQPVQPERSPKRIAQPHISKGSSTFHPQTVEGQTATLCLDGPLLNSSGCALFRPVMANARSRAFARPCASSSPSCATVSCTTLPLRRTDRTRRQ